MRTRNVPVSFLDGVKEVDEFGTWDFEQPEQACALEHRVGQLKAAKGSGQLH